MYNEGAQQRRFLQARTFPLPTLLSLKIDPSIKASQQAESRGCGERSVVLCVCVLVMDCCVE